MDRLMADDLWRLPVQDLILNAAQTSAAHYRAQAAGASENGGGRRKPDPVFRPFGFGAEIRRIGGFRVGLAATELIHRGRLPVAPSGTCWARFITGSRKGFPAPNSKAFILPAGFEVTRTRRRGSNHPARGYHSAGVGHPAPGWPR